MFSYFRTASPFKWLGLFFLLVTIRLIAYLIGLPTSLPDIMQHQVAVKLASGALLYRDVYTDLPPLTAQLMGYLELFAPGNQWLDPLLATILVGFQAYVLVNISLTVEVFTEKNFTPGLIYILVASVVPDFLTLSPPLLCLTFLLPAFARITKHIRIGVAEEEMLGTGLLLGCATLCFLPASLLIVFLILVYALYSGANLRHFLLLITGVVLPNLLMFLVWYWQNAGSYYYHNYLLSLLGGTNYVYLNGFQILMLFLGPVLFWVLALIRIYTTNRFINYQNIMQTVMILWAIVGLFAIALSFDGTPEECLLVLPPVVFMLSHYFQSFHRSVVIEGTFIFFMGGMVGTLLVCTAKPYMLEPTLPISDLYISKNLPYQQTSAKQLLANDLADKKVWVVGHSYGYYQSASLAGPFLDYALSERLLTKLDEYESVNEIYQQLERDKPAVIIDEQQLVPKLFSRMPVLATYYQRIGKTNRYELKTIPEVN